MPNIRFSGVKEEDIVSISKELASRLEKEVGINTKPLSLEYISSVFIFDGEKNNRKEAVVEIIWFKRDSVTNSKTVGIINDLLGSLGYKKIRTFFTETNEELFFINRVNYKEYKQSLLKE